jgi:hypothetical protein
MIYLPSNGLSGLKRTLNYKQKEKLRINIVMTNVVGRVYGNRCSKLGWVLVDSFAPKLVGYHSR